ncbi:hypothetical protein NIES4102_42040 (plasmid) [Chondrocystis sp. NIES-4102]|nr:hypothetical protein NIES4102_42040 [Chondrocystis sp. NIES-4102]
MQQDVLQKRLDSLEWTSYRLAQEVDRLRGSNKGAGNYTSTVNKVLANPNKCQIRTLEEVVQAMGGEIFIRWSKTEVVTVSYEDVKVSS